MREYAVGVDLGGTNTVVGIIDKKGKTIIDNAKNPIKTEDYRTSGAFINELARVINAFAKEIGGHNKIEGIGIGAPNASHQKKIIENPPNLFKDEPTNKDGNVIIEMAKLVGEKTKLPVFLDNDANAAALGEKKYGKAKSLDNFIVITLGTGLGSGIFSEGKLIRGANGIAGELGHLIVRRSEGRKCGCGRFGCIEAYASAKGVARTALEFLEVSKKGEVNILNDLYKQRKINGLSGLSEERRKEGLLINSKEICDAARKNDPIALEIFKYTGKILGEALAEFAVTIDPATIFLFGGLTKSGDLILKPTAESFEKSLMSVFKGKVKIELSALNNNALAAVLGASALVWEGK